MEIKKSHKLFAIVGAAAITISAGWASMNGNNQENLHKNAIDIAQCASNFQANLNDIDSLHSLAKKQAKSFASLKKHDESVALDLFMDNTSSVSDGLEAKQVAKQAEKTMLRNVGSFEVDLDNPGDKSKIIQLCENSKVRANIEEAREIIIQNDSPKSSLDKYKPK